MSNYFNKYWILPIAILLACLVAGGIFLAIKLNSQRPVEISITPTTPPNYHLEVFIDGAVANPGIYPARGDDTLANLVQAAGITADANPTKIKLYIPRVNKSSLQPTPQKINLNRAETWLLEALSGIGESKAQAIVDYRNTNGPFHRIEDLLKVSGISKSSLDNMKDFITVED